ncbi:MAG: Ig-like domain-containing protein, partial [Kosmotogaceae bacterium]
MTNKKNNIHHLSKSITIIIFIVIIAMIITGCIEDPPGHDNEPPIIQLQNQTEDEGKTGQFDVYISDNEGIKEIDINIERYTTQLGGSEPNFIIYFYPEDPNENGEKVITVAATDFSGNYAEETAILNVIDTPDLVYDMPEKFSLVKGETSTYDATIIDDYTPGPQIQIEGRFEPGEFTITQKPDNEGNFSFSVKPTQTGTGTITITATDTENMSNTWEKVVNVQEEPNEPPAITAPTSVSFDEGQNHSFNIEVTDDSDTIDELTFTGNCTQYNVSFNKIDATTMEITVSPKTGQENYNGTTTLEITVEDTDGGSSSKDVQLNVADTPDVEFYDMPSSVTIQDGENKTIEGNIKDDYTTLENLLMTVTCNHASVSLTKKTGDLFEITINANESYIGEATIVITAEDEEGNNNTYNLPLTITEEPNEPPAITAPTSVSFDEGQNHSFNIEVTDDSDTIDELTFTGKSTQYNVTFNKIDATTMEVTVSPKTGQENYNGTTNLEITVEDTDGGETTENITLNVSNTPDV